MADQRTFVIVGAGMAGAKAAETLREEGFTGRVVLLGEEPERPYERPPLSKGLLLGTDQRDSAFVHDAGWYAEHDVDLRTSVTVDAVDPTARRVRIAGGDDLAYDRLLLAPGATPRTLPIPGGDSDGLLYLRTMADSARIDSVVRDGTRLVIIGAGWIGLEVAAAARQRGATVTVVEAAGLPLQRILGDRIAQVFADLHREHGVAFRFDAKVGGITGEEGSWHVALGNGAGLDADAVLVAVGVAPNTGLAQRAGLKVDNGVLVDDRLRSSDPDIFAAGDVANIAHPVLRTRLRVEHWANALNTGPVAARAMLDQEVSYDRLPYFFTDQYDLGMEYSGWVSSVEDTEVVVRGDLERREFVAFWTVDGRVAAGMNVNVWDVNDDVQALIRAGIAGRTVDPARLADADVPLTEL